MMNGNDFRLYQGMDTSEFLAHYGKGHLDGGNSGRYKWGSGKNPHQRSGKRVFVSGSSKTQDKESGYYRRKLPKAVRAELDIKMKNGDTILVGDAPGIDRQVQDYLKKKRYKNVEVFSPGYKGPRYNADEKHWLNRRIDVPWAEEGSAEWLAGKDKVMSEIADEGIAVILDNGAAATRKNVGRLFLEGKDVSVYELSGVKEAMDKWVDQNGKEVILDTYRKDGKDEYQFYRSNLSLKELALDAEKMDSQSREASEYRSMVYNNLYDDDKYLKLVNEITSRSINIYDDTPKSDRAKLAVKERDEAYEREIKPLKEKLADSDMPEMERAAYRDAAEQADNHYTKLKSQGMTNAKAATESDKIYQQLIKAFKSGEAWKAYEKAYDEAELKERQIYESYQEKIPHIILQDLGFRDTEENIELLKKSKLLFIP